MMKNEWSIESTDELLFPQHLATILTIDDLAANGSLKAESFEIRNCANSSTKDSEKVGGCVILSHLDKSFRWGVGRGEEQCQEASNMTRLAELTAMIRITKPDCSHSPL